MYQSYPGKFKNPVIELIEVNFVSYTSGFRFGQQIGPEESDFVREILLAEIEKRKNPKSKLQKLTDILTGLEHFRTTNWMRDFGPRWGG